MTHNSAAPLLRHIRKLAAPRTDLPDRECLDRFAARGDEEAFAALVDRHGPMVLRVCRAVVRDAHAAEDAFQATFLTLARRAAAVRKEHALCSWLYKVAHRIALRARGRSAERSRREAAAVVRRPAPGPLDEASWREVQAIFLDELGRLSECYRAPLLLCCLEGLTRDEAAAQLGRTPATLKMHLERGRRLLRARLAHRGLTLSAGLLAAELARAGGVTTSPALVAATVRAATALRAGGAVADIAPERVVCLSAEALRVATSRPLTALLRTLLVVGTLAVGGAYFFNHSASAPPPAAGTGREKPVATPDSGAARNDLFGDPLPPEAVARLGTVRLRQASLQSVGFTPDGKTLLTQSGEGVRTWDAATGKLLRAFPKETTAGGNGIILSPDGKCFVTASDSGIHIWNISSGQLVCTVGSRAYLTVRFSPDGKLIAALSDSFPQFVEVLEVETRKLQWSKDPGRWPMIALEFTADSKTLILAGWAVRSIPPATDNTLVFLDARTGVEQQRIDLGTRAPDRIALSPDGTRLVGICHGAKTFERGLLVWDVAGRKETLRMDPSKNEVVRGQDYFSALAFARGGKSLVTAGGFDGLIEWDLATGKELRRLGRRTMNADCLALAPDGKTLAVAWGSAVRLLDAATGEDRLPEAGHFYRINGAAVTPDGGTVYTYSAGPSMMLWEAATGRLKGRVEAPELGSQWYGVVDDGRTAFSTTVMGTTLLVHDLPSGKIRSRVPLDFAGDRAGPVAVSPDGRTVACKSYASESIQLVSVATGQRLRTLEDPGMKNCRVAFTAGGQTLLVSCADHTFQVWDPVKGIKLRQFGPIGDSSSPNPLPIGQDFAGYEFAVSTDGARVAYANERGQFALIDAVTGRELPRRALPRVSNAVFAFSPDSRTLAWGARRDPVLHLMEVASGKDRCVLNGHGSGVSSLSFSADGTTLVAGCEDSTALVRDLTGRRTRAKADGPLTAGGLDARWTALAGEDAAKAFQAIRELANSPDETLPYLARRLRPVPAADEKRLTRLIADLDGEAFAVREKAGGELADIGDAALASCHKALAGRPSAEVRSRLEGIVEKRAQAWRALSGEELRTERALEVLERIGTPPARRFLDRLAGGLPEARLTREAKAATERLSRRESPAP